MLQMYVRYRTLMLLGMGICLMLETRLYVMPVISFIAPIIHPYFICTVLYIIMWIACMVCKSIHDTIFPYTKFVNKFLWIIAILLIVEIWYTFTFSVQDISDVLTTIRSYFRLLAIYPLIYLLESYEERTVTKAILCIVGIMMIYCAYVAIVYNATGSILNTSLIDSTNWTRNGRIRIRSIALFWVFSLLAYNEFLNSREFLRRVWYGILTTLSVSYIILVNQSRAQSIAIVAMLVGMFLFKKKRNTTQLITILVVMVIAAIYFNSDSFNSFLFTFSENYSENTTTVRFLILEDFLRVIDQMPAGYLLGCGLGGTVTVNGVDRYFIDLGLIGDLLNTGILALALYVGMVGRILNTYFAIRFRDEKGHTFVLGALFFLLFGALGFTLNPSTRFMAIPVILAYEEYYRYRAVKEDNIIEEYENMNITEVGL